MSNFFKILVFLWLGIWVVIGTMMLFDTPEQMESDKEFVKKEIKPSVDFIKDFKITHNRLPTNREYYTWQRDYHNDFSSDLTQKEDSLIPGFGRINYIRKTTDLVSEDKEKLIDADWSKDYAIAVWRGEWMEYYFSWSDTYDTNNYSWINGFFELLWCSIIGCIPVVIWKIKRKKEAHNNI